MLALYTFISELTLSGDTQGISGTGHVGNKNLGAGSCSPYALF